MAWNILVNKENKATYQIGLAMVAVVLVLLSAIVCLYPSGLASIFTKDQVFSDRVVQSSLALAAVMVTMNLTVALEVNTS